VADRWHLLRNLGDAVQALVDRQHAAVQLAAKQVGEPKVVPVAAVSTAAQDSARSTAAARRRQASYTRRQARYEDAARLHAAGASISHIGAQLGADRKTVRAWLQAGGAPLWRHSLRAGILAPYCGQLERRWTEGCRNAARLWREIVQLGFSGRPGTVRTWAGQRRKREMQATTGIAGVRVAKWQPPSIRQVARMLMANTDTLHEAERTFVPVLLAQVPELADGIAVAKRLNLLLRKKSDETLTRVLDDAAGTMLRDFAASLRRDLAAVQAALDLPWTTSPAEGQINRLKMLKRTMYGRAGFDLLRARVLHVA
jgi:transposase